MRHPRYYNYAVILPDQSILILGGKMGKKGHIADHNKNILRRRHDHGHGEG